MGKRHVWHVLPGEPALWGSKWPWACMGTPQIPYWCRWSRGWSWHFAPQGASSAFSILTPKGPSVPEHPAHHSALSSQSSPVQLSLSPVGLGFLRDPNQNQAFPMEQRAVGPEEGCCVHQPCDARCCSSCGEPSWLRTGLTRLWEGEKWLGRAQEPLLCPHSELGSPTHCFPGSLCCTTVGMQPKRRLRAGTHCSCSFAVTAPSPAVILGFFLLFAELPQNREANRCSSPASAPAGPPL